ncbi:MAG: 2-oxo acid dehydrogenase acyltransferase catalytic domain protein [Capsulimonas sp.]|nr:2-oxo acid dehydrogenase acyltransferase catalytic domain protein [Capsulimonas sp.]
MGHIPLGKTQPLTTYRKIAIASWRAPRDPSTYSWFDLPIEEAEAFLNAYPSDPKPSLTYFIGKIVANCLEEHPALNHLLRQDRLYQRARTDVFITTLLNTPVGRDLSGFVLRDVPNHSLGEMAQQAEDALALLRAGKDEDTEKIDKITSRLPIWLLRITMWLEDFFHYTLNVSLRKFGMPDDRFGSVMISNFGVLGIENALVPLSPYCRCPLILGVGRPRPMPIVRKGEVVVAECVTISFTFDHRYADGVHGGQMMRRFQKIFLNPKRFPEVFDEVKMKEREQSMAQ